MLGPGHSISSECGSVPPAPWLLCGAVVALAALTLALVVERRRQRGIHWQRGPSYRVKPTRSRVRV
jgi:hypothetical protein